MLSLTELFIPFFYSMEQMTPKSPVFNFYLFHSRRPPARGVVEYVIIFLIHSPYYLYMANVFGFIFFGNVLHIRDNFSVILIVFAHIDRNNFRKLGKFGTFLNIHSRIFFKLFLRHKMSYNTSTHLRNNSRFNLIV